MAMGDRSDIELTAGNKDRIAVEPWHGRVSIFVVDGSGSVEGEAHVVMEAPECDALIAAIGRALGRPAPASTPLALYFEEKAKTADKGTAHGEATGNTWLRDHSKTEAKTWRHAASLVVEAAHGEQGATVPRAGVAAVLADIDALTGEDERAIAGIRASLAALLAPAPAPITVTVRRHQNDFKVYASYVKNRSVVVIDEHPGSWRVLSVTGDGEECIVKLESWRADTAATLEAAGLWPVAAPGGER